MPKGLKIPVGVDERGRAAVETNEVKNTRKILELALSEGEDDNAFQNLGIDDRLIYSIKNASFRGRAITAVKRIFLKYQLLARLVESSIKFSETTEGEIEMEFKYLDLLTQKEETFLKGFKRR